MISLSLVHIEVLCGQLYMNSVKNTSTLKTVNFALHGFLLKLFSRAYAATHKNCRAIGEDKIAVCEKIAGLRSGNSSDLDSACLNVLVPVKISQI